MEKEDPGGDYVSVGALFGGSVFGWLIAGAALYYAFSSSGMSMTQPKFDAFSDPGVGAGHWQASTTSQTVIPRIHRTVVD